MPNCVVVTGSFPPDVCGVGDYTEKFVTHLEKAGATVQVFSRSSWSIARFPEYLHEIDSIRPSILNIQYPTEGYGYSLLPQLICAFAKAGKKVVTLHEFSSKSIKGKIAIALFFIFADVLVFTSVSERIAALRIGPWIRKRSVVIPIGGNIPIEQRGPLDTDVAYFGLIRPIKGIEDYLSIVSELSAKRNVKSKLIGKIVPGYEQYAEAILKRASESGVALSLDRSSQEVARLLAQTRVALLPFPDGISSRRGSALAAMANGALVVTTPPSTGEEMRIFRQLCIFRENHEKLVNDLVEILDNYDHFDATRRAGQSFALSRSWESVVKSFLEFVDLRTPDNVIS